MDSYKALIVGLSGNRMNAFGTGEYFLDTVQGGLLLMKNAVSLEQGVRNIRPDGMRLEVGVEDSVRNLIEHVFRVVD
jgi:hypothetical protein